VTGGPLNRLRERVIDRLPPKQRHRMLVAHCSGAEVWGFDKDGSQHKVPFYSVYDKRLTERQKRDWRTVVGEMIAAFKLEVHPVMLLEEFKARTKGNPLAVMCEDRGPQITLEIINGYAMTPAQHAQVKAQLPNLKEVIDLREPLHAWISDRLRQAGVPVTPRFGGVFALDLAIEGVSKAETVKHVLASPHILEHIGQAGLDLADPDQFEIWGDRFDSDRGTDWLMCVAVDSRVRAIDFRPEDPSRFPAGYNIVVWPGPHELQDGALEYLRPRK
jgi:hypothetical protein